MVLTLRSIKPDAFFKKLLDPIKLTLILDNTTQINEDIEFTIIYTGDPENDEHDQIICEELVGPIPIGKVGFELETSIISFENIPLESLFGVTSIILEGKYRGQQFLRVGYFVNVSYPGVPGLCCEEDGDDVDEEYTIDETEHDEYEDLEDEGGDLEDEEEDLEDDEEEEEDDLEGGEDDLNEGDSEGDLNERDDLNENKEDNLNEVDSDEEDKNKTQVKIVENKSSINPKISETSMVGESSFSEINRELNKNILEGPDEIEEKNKFIYDEMVLDKTKIEIELSDPPLVTVFNINWGDENEDNESDENDEDEVNHEVDDNKFYGGVEQ